MTAVGGKPEPIQVPRAWVSWGSEVVNVIKHPKCLRLINALVDSLLRFGLADSTGVPYLASNTSLFVL